MCEMSHLVFEFNQYTIDVNVEATKNAYSKLPIVSESCSCQGCENYMAAIEKLPNEIISFFTTLGVDIKRPSEVFRSFERNGFYSYCLSFTFVYNFVFEKAKLYTKVNERQYKQNPDMIIHLTPYFSVWFESECSLVPENFPTPHFQVSIDARLPWVLERPYFDDTIPLSKAEKVCSGTATLRDKKMKSTILGKKYMFVFTMDDKPVKLFVKKALYEYLQLGWSGSIVYFGKKLINISKK